MHLRPGRKLDTNQDIGRPARRRRPDADVHVGQREVTDDQFELRIPQLWMAGGAFHNTIDPVDREGIDLGVSCAYGQQRLAHVVVERGVVTES